MGWLDRKLEEKFQKNLHKKRNYYIQKAIDEYVAHHHPAPEVIPILRAKLESEADRVYAIVDKSILRERIKRAKWTFWISAFSSVVIIGILGGFSAGAALPFIIPVCAAFVTWLITLGTIPISYNQRIQGAMDSTLVAFEKSQQNTEEVDLRLYTQEISGFKVALVELIQKFNEQNPDQNIALTNDNAIVQQIQSLKKSIDALNFQVNVLNTKLENLRTSTIMPTENPLTRDDFRNSVAFQEALTQAIKIYQASNFSSQPKKTKHRLHFWHHKEKKLSSEEQARKALEQSEKKDVHAYSFYKPLVY